MLENRAHYRAHLAIVGVHSSGRPKLLTTACDEQAERHHVHAAPLHRMLSAVRVPRSFHPQPGCWYPAVGIVVELRARGHQVVGLSGRSVAATLTPLGVELFTDEMSPWPSAFGAGPAVDLDQALRRTVHVARAHRDHVAQLLLEERSDLVLADGFRLGVGVDADAVGVP